MEERKKRIEDGGGENDREKYELVNSDGQEDSDDIDDSNENGAFFYFETKEKIPDFEDNSRKVDGDQRNRENDIIAQQRSNNKKAKTTNPR